MKVLLASSEVHPYSKSGGLADMVGALAKTLAQAGLRVGMVSPLHRGIRETFRDVRPMNWEIELPLGSRTVRALVWCREWEPGLTAYFIDQSDFFDRPGLYGERDEDYPDNAERFIFFSKCATHLARYLPWKPDIVHAHDWQTGLIPLFIRHLRERGGWGSAPPVCLTIHNLAYQGNFPGEKFAFTNLPGEYFQPEGVEFYGRLNCLKAGIVYAGSITTVSPRYAREILTEAHGLGLDGVLRNRQKDLHGILNGIDDSEWSTRGNPFLPADYSDRNLGGKWEAKVNLRQELDLPNETTIPLFGNISRLVGQKGSDILLGSLEEMLPTGLQFVLLGSGSPKLEDAYLDLQSRHPGQVRVRIGYDHALSHRIEAGSDFYVMPSLFEPCGLNQMYSLRYGTVPVVRATGGLDDTVVDASEDSEKANGIKFYDYSRQALSRALRKALSLFEAPAALRLFRRNGMRADFSWNRRRSEYLHVYRRTIEAAPAG